MDFRSHGPSEPREPTNFQEYADLSRATDVLRVALSEFQECLEEYQWAGRPDGPPTEVPRGVYGDVVDMAEQLLEGVGAVRPVSAPYKRIVPEPPKVCVFQLIIGLSFIGITIAAIAGYLR